MIFVIVLTLMFLLLVVLGLCAEVDALRREVERSDHEYVPHLRGGGE